MRSSFFLIFFLCCFSLFGQKVISGRVINKETKEPLAYATIQFKDGSHLLTNIDGSFELEPAKKKETISVSYVGFQTLKLKVNQATQFLQIELTPRTEQLETVVISSKTNPANKLIRRAIVPSTSV